MGVSRPKPFSEEDWLDYIRACENQGKGSSLLLVGVTGAGHEWAPHFLADALAWSVHALGDEGDIESPRTLCTTRDFNAFRRTTRSILQGESRQHLIGVLDVPLLTEQERERLVNESQHPVVLFDCLSEKQVLRFLKKELGLPVYMKIHKENPSSQPTQLPYINFGNRRMRLRNLDGIAPEDLRAVQASQGNPLAASPLGYLTKYHVLPSSPFTDLITVPIAANGPNSSSTLSKIPLSTTGSDLVYVVSLPGNVYSILPTNINVT
jgi:hypothetical protein